MTKYDFELKKKVVMAYFNGEGGKYVLAKKYGITSPCNVLKWINNFKKFGDQGLIHPKNKKTYSFEKKLSVVELYLSGKFSYQELALQEGILNPSQITNWVRVFRVAGPEALRSRRKGRIRKLEKLTDNRKSRSDNGSSSDKSAEYIKQLEDELLRLRIENAFLKELRRLRLEEETLLKKQRESSTVSEDSSN